jgi:hypothetical protein
MNTIKKMMTATTLMMILMVGTSFGGILVQGRSAQDTQPCTDSTQTSKGGIILSDATGILVQGFTGILVQGFTGILVQGIKDNTPVDCGILVQG